MSDDDGFGLKEIGGEEDVEVGGGGEDDDGAGPIAAFSSSVSFFMALTFRFRVSEEPLVCSKKGASTHHFMRGASGGTAVMGRDTPGRG